MFVRNITRVIQDLSLLYRSKNAHLINNTYGIFNTYNRHQHNVCTESEEVRKILEDGEENSQYAKIRDEYIGILPNTHRVLVVQPYIKWGRNKRTNTSPKLQLSEAVSLVDTLSGWIVVSQRCVPLLTLNKQYMFGTGNLDILRQEAIRCNATALFISTNLLKFAQLMNLQRVFDLPIYDRYSIVIHIFKQHAKSAEAKLQVALAELPYVYKKMNEVALQETGRVWLNDTTKEVFQNRAKKLEKALDKLQNQRKLTRSNRQQYGLPTIAVVGYTNAGKTSLIKALTDDGSLTPENKLFATLDTTVHKGRLQSDLDVLYVDTIGFIQDVPEMLLKPFLVTLKDAIEADVIIHIFDISHPDAKAQLDHVSKTLQTMIDKDKALIHVANKCDLVSDISSEFLPKETIYISAAKLTGIKLLLAHLNKAICACLGYKQVRVRVKLGSAEEAWFYKETTVQTTEPDPTSMEHTILHIITTDLKLKKFKSYLEKCKKDLDR